MEQRIHVPFDTWAMRVDVPVSQLVMQDGLGFSCGQCPLGKAGEVLKPGNLVAQTEIVMVYIARLLKRVRARFRDAAKLTVYFVDPGGDQRQQMQHILRSSVGERCLITLVEVPHFYYNGMMLEVDVAIDLELEQQQRGVIDHNSGATLQYLRGKRIFWTSLYIPAQLNNVDTGKLVGQMLEDAGHTPGAENLLSERWFQGGAPQHQNGLRALRKSLSQEGWLAQPDAIPHNSSNHGAGLNGELEFVVKQGRRTAMSTMDGDVSLICRTSSGMAWVRAFLTTPVDDLPGETRLDMDAIGVSLAQVGLDFSQVVKLSAYYAGGATAEELHGNMSVRHSYYVRPGPASTGLPVKAVGERGCRIAIDALALIQNVQ